MQLSIYLPTYLFTHHSYILTVQTISVMYLRYHMYVRVCTQFSNNHRDSHRGLLTLHCQLVVIDVRYWVLNINHLLQVHAVRTEVGKKSHDSRETTAFFSPQASPPTIRSGRYIFNTKCMWLLYHSSASRSKHSPITTLPAFSAATITCKGVQGRISSLFP